MSRRMVEFPSVRHLVARGDGDAATTSSHDQSTSTNSGPQPTVSTTPADKTQVKHAQEELVGWDLTGRSTSDLASLGRQETSAELARRHQRSLVRLGQTDS